MTHYSNYVIYKVKFMTQTCRGLFEVTCFLIPVGIKGTFWALIDFSLFAIGPNLHCPRVFRSLHLFFLLWLAIIDHSLHIWSTLLLHFWIRTDWNFLEIINGIISLLHNMITLWPIFIYNLTNRINSVETESFLRRNFDINNLFLGENCFYKCYREPQVRL